jgi:hypothetical protein
MILKYSIFVIFLIGEYNVIMINKSSIKVILAFTGVILLGLISLVVLDSYKTDDGATKANSANLTK